MQIAIIVPCYNEFRRLDTENFANFIQLNPVFKICFVNDGSKDGTNELLDSFAGRHPEQVFVLHQLRNQGKGESVRAGMCFMLEKFDPDFLCYVDADLSSPLEEAVRLVNIMALHEDLLCVFGSRVSVFGSRISRLNYRHYGGRVVATMIDMVLKLSIYDTQCGLKVFRNSLAKKIFTTPFLSRWLFDVEIFAKLKLIYSRPDLFIIMKEVPVDEWTEMGDSKLRFKDLFCVPFLLIRIRSRYRSKKSRVYAAHLEHNIIPAISTSQKI